MAKGKTEARPTEGIADFNWEALELQGYTQVERSELSDRYEKTLTSIKRSNHKLRLQIRRCCCI